VTESLGFTLCDEVKNVLEAKRAALLCAVRKQPGESITFYARQIDSTHGYVSKTIHRFDHWFVVEDCDEDGRRHEKRVRLSKYGETLAQCLHGLRFQVHHNGMADT